MTRAVGMRRHLTAQGRAHAQQRITHFAVLEVEGFLFACALENARYAVAHDAYAVAWTANPPIRQSMEERLMAKPKSCTRPWVLLVCVCCMRACACVYMLRAA